MPAAPAGLRRQGRAGAGIGRGRSWPLAAETVGVARCSGRGGVFMMSGLPR
jgi:hypothetical protein